MKSTPAEIESATIGLGNFSNKIQQMCVIGVIAMLETSIAAGPKDEQKKDTPGSVIVRSQTTIRGARRAGKCTCVLRSLERRGSIELNCPRGSGRLIGTLPPHQRGLKRSFKKMLAAQLALIIIRVCKNVVYPLEMYYVLNSKPAKPLHCMLNSGGFFFFSLVIS